MLSTKLASVSSVSATLEGINKLLVEKIVEGAADEKEGDSNRGSCDMVHPKSLSLFRYTELVCCVSNLNIRVLTLACNVSTEHRCLCKWIIAVLAMLHTMIEI